MMEALEKQISVVAKARQKRDIALVKRSLAQQEWVEQNKDLMDAVADTASVVSEAETTLRDLTLKAYAETGNKAPAPGVGIREVVKLDYDIAKAFDWALEHRIALQLNKSAFDKLAKTAPETRPAFVMVTTEPQATIATELEVKE